MEECGADKYWALFLPDNMVQKLMLSKNINDKSSFPNPIFDLEKSPRLNKRFLT